MSFTGNATYAELYPSRPSIDVVQEKIYEAGSVFLDTDIDEDEIGLYTRLYLLVRVNEQEFMFVGINDGNRWANTPITLSTNTQCTYCTEHDFVAHAGKDFRFIGMAEDVLDISNQVHRIMEEIEYNEGDE